MTVHSGHRGFPTGDAADFNQVGRFRRLFRMPARLGPCRATFRDAMGGLCADSGW
jgi:hypothetical protein